MTYAATVVIHGLITRNFGAGTLPPSFVIRFGKGALTKCMGKWSIPWDASARHLNDPNISAPRRKWVRSTI